MTTDTGNDEIIQIGDKDWIRQKGAAARLGVDPRTVQRLAACDKIRTAKVPGMERGRFYCVRDIDAIKEHGVDMGGLTLHLCDGAPSLSRRIEAVPEQSLVERLDYCWAFLDKYGLLRGEVSERVRNNVSYAVVKSKRKREGLYACLDPSRETRDERD